MLAALGKTSKLFYTHLHNIYHNGKKRKESNHHRCDP